MFYRWLFISIVCGLSAIFALPVRAQQTPALRQLEIFLWPEYDRPEVLVIYTLELKADVPLPTQIALRIPSASGAPNAVATAANWQEARQGNFLNVPYERKVQGEWATIEIGNLTTPIVRIEYYDALTRTGQQREYTFLWVGDYATESLSVQVQHPLNSTQMQIEPAFGSSFIGNDNLTYSVYTGGALAAGQTFSVHLSYTKADNTLSSSALQVVPVAPVTDNTAGRSNWTSSGLPWLLGIAGLVLIVGGGVWYWQTTRTTITSTPKMRRRKPKSATPPAKNAASPAARDVYCHQCGNRAVEGDRFCRTCGTRLRVE